MKNRLTKHSSRRKNRAAEFQRYWARSTLPLMDDRFATSHPKNDQRTILRVVQRFLGRSLYVDRAILECVYGLYEEPELNPWIETGYDPDITHQLKALDELIKRELPPEA